MGTYKSKPISATLLYKVNNSTEGNRRYYKLSKPITQGVDGNSVEKSIQACITRPEDTEVGSFIVPKTTAWDTVVISDASTHKERLLFLGYYQDPEQHGIIDFIPFAGVFMDFSYPETVPTDDYLLMLLASVNGYDYIGIMSVYQRNRYGYYED